MYHLPIVLKLESITLPMICIRILSLQLIINASLLRGKSRFPLELLRTRFVVRFPDSDDKFALLNKINCSISELYDTV